MTPTTQSIAASKAGPIRGEALVSAVELLLPAWGLPHLRQFLDFGLPTMLAPGNIPALAQTLPTRFTLMTRRDEIPIVLSHPAWQRLCQICQTTVHPIDDLIIEGHHAVTLTLAYEQAMRVREVAMRETCFFFLVADFLLADGALMRVLRSINEGASGVVAGNFQIVAEDAAPVLRSFARHQSALVLPPRKLMELSLAHLHPATVANIVNYPTSHNPEANRLFWRVDDATLLGRFFLMHMIAIRPEVTAFQISAPSDYSFIPELCPSGRIDVMTNSDEYLAVEMQPRIHDTRGHRPGPIDPKALSRTLSRWATAQHRANAQRQLVFHVAGVPSHAGRTVQEADVFLAKVEQHLVSPPQPHRNQPYWLAAMVEWQFRPLQATAPASPRGRLRMLLAHLRLEGLGRTPRVRPWHPRWPEFWGLQKLLDRRLMAGDRLLVVSHSPQAFANWLDQAPYAVTSWDRTQLDTPERELLPLRSFDAALLVMPADLSSEFAPTFERLKRFVKPGGPFIVMATNRVGDDAPEDIGHAFMVGASDLLAAMPCVEECQLIRHGSIGRCLQRIMLWLARAGYGHPLKLIPSLLLIGGFFAPASLISNLAALHAPRLFSRRATCSSVIMVGRASGDAFRHHLGRQPVTLAAGGRLSL
jgi:hypothetical protein